MSGNSEQALSILSARIRFVPAVVMLAFGFAVIMATVYPFVQGLDRWCKSLITR